MSKSTTLALCVENASGHIDFPFTNDYMFRAALQGNMHITKALVASLLHLEIGEIMELTITNPIELGAAISNKDFILDLRVLLNRNRIINLEMQVLNRHNWSERSLSYACRCFDQLKTGEEYHAVLPVINIGFLDYTLFEDAPEFYSRNLLMNVKTHKIYSDKLDIRVVELNQIHLATVEDKLYHIDHWARLFKATTWEEIRMIAKNDTYLNEAAQTLYEMNADDMIRQQCLARRDAERDEFMLHQQLTQAAEELAEALSKNATLQQDNDILLQDNNLLQQEVGSLQQNNEALQQDIDALRKLLIEHGIQPTN